MCIRDRFTGADLENLLNEAAIEAARKGRGFILQSDIKGAFIKVGIGAEKKSKVISEKEKKITAYHESCLLYTSKIWLTVNNKGDNRGNESSPFLILRRSNS